MGKYMVRNGELEGRRFRLEPGAKITLGRELSDLNFPDKRMSRRHCELDAREDGDHVQDLESTNGTWVNSQKVREALLRPGDLVRVGFTEFEFLGVPPSLPHDPAVVRADQTIAFRALGARNTPPTERHTRQRGNIRLMAPQMAAKGQRPADTKRALISAKGKFCEACGEAIFLKEGAADEGVMIEGLYLCRMCGLIAEKQKELGRDLLPSYAKIVGGRIPGAGQADPEVPTAAEPGGSMEIVEEEVDLDDLVPADAEGSEPAKTAPFNAAEVAGTSGGADAGPASDLAPGEEAERAGDGRVAAYSAEAAPAAKAGSGSSKEATRRDRERAPEETEPDEIDILKAVERAVAAREAPDVGEQEDQNAGEPQRGSDVDNSGAGEGGGSPVAGQHAEEPQEAGAGGTVEMEQEPQDAGAGGGVEEEGPPDQGDET